MDPGEVLFVNENLGGHASMHLSLREALPEVHPGLDAEFIDVPELGHVPQGRLGPGARCSAGSTWTCTRCASSSRESEVARRLLRRRAAARARGPDVLHVYTQSIALRSVDVLRADAVGRLDRRDVPPGRVPPARTGARPGSPARPCASRSSSSGGCTPRRRLLVAQSEWVADSLHRAYGIDLDRIRVIPFGLHRGPTPRPRTSPAGLPEVTFVGATLDRKGGRPAAARLPRAAARPLRAQPRDPRRDRARSRGCAVFSDFEPGDPRLPELLARTSVFAFPTEMDNSPYCVLEAMRAGVPVVTHAGRRFAGNGARTAGPGCWPRTTTTRSAAAIGALLDDPERADAMGAAGRGRASTRCTTPGSRPASCSTS